MVVSVVFYQYYFKLSVAQHAVSQGSPPQLPKGLAAAPREQYDILAVEVAFHLPVPLAWKTQRADRTAVGHALQQGYGGVVSLQADVVGGEVSALGEWTEQLPLPTLHDDSFGGYLVMPAEAVHRGDERTLVLFRQVLYVQPHPFFRTLLKVGKEGVHLQPETLFDVVGDIQPSVGAQADVHLKAAVFLPLLLQFLRRIAAVEPHFFRIALILCGHKGKHARTACGERQTQEKQ